MAYPTTYAYGSFIPATDDPTLKNVLAMTRLEQSDLTADQLLLIRDIKPEAYKVSNDADLLRDLEFRGQVDPAFTTNVYHYEVGEHFRAGQIATVSSSSSTTAVVTLTAESFVTSGSKYASPLTPSDNVMIFKSDGSIVHARVRLKSNLTPTNGQVPTHTASGAYTTAEAGETSTPTAGATSYTLERLSGGSPASMATVCVSGALIVAYSASMASGDYFKVEGKYQAFKQRTATFQIIDDYAEMTGESANSKYGFSVGGRDLVYDVQKAALLERFRMQEGFTHLFNPGGTAAVTGVSQTQGIIPRVQEFGNNYTYVRSDGFVLDDLKNLIKDIKLQTTARSFTWYLGPEVAEGVWEALRGVGSGGSFIYGNFTQGLEAKLDFKVFTYNGCTFFIKESNIFNYRNVTGLFGSPYPGYGLLIPNMDISTQTAQEGITNNPALRLRFIPRDGQRYQEVPGGPQTNGRDVKSLTIMTQTTHQMMGARNFWLVRGTGMPY